MYLCKIANKEADAKLLYEDGTLLAFEDINPKAPIHILIIPKKHIATLNDISENDIQLTGKMLQVAQQLAKKLGIAEDGYRVIINCNQQGGQEVFHIHFHLLGGKQLSWPKL